MYRLWIYLKIIKKQSTSLPTFKLIAYSWNTNKKIQLWNGSLLLSQQECTNKAKSKSIAIVDYSHLTGYRSGFAHWMHAYPVVFGYKKPVCSIYAKLGCPRPVCIGRRGMKLNFHLTNMTSSIIFEDSKFSVASVAAVPLHSGLSLCVSAASQWFRPSPSRRRVCPTCSWWILGICSASTRRVEGSASPGLWTMRVDITSTACRSAPPNPTQASAAWQRYVHTN